MFALLVLAWIAPASVIAYIRGGNTAATGVAIFVCCLFLMLLASTLYHAMEQESKHKAVFQILDHIFIYVAIAGTYTPIALSVIRGWQGIVIACVQWAMVIAGILYRAVWRKSIPRASVSIYLVMGWTIVFFFPLFLQKANPVLTALICAGGVLYSGGVFFYSKKGMKYTHFVWHLFVDLGALCHFI